MATEQKPTTKTTLTHEHLDRLSGMLEGLKADARQAHADGDVIMLSVYNDLLAVASRIVTKAYARVERQERAEINKAHKNLRKALRDSADTNSDQSEQ